MEKLPMGERPEPRIVGRGPSHAKAEELENIRDRFGEGHLAQFSEEQYKELSAGERERAPVEREAIAAANEISNQLLDKFGLQPFNVPERNVHFVNDKIWNRLNDGDSSQMITDPFRQAVFAHNEAFAGKMEAQKNVQIAVSLFHEFLHLKGHTAMEVDSETESGVYRFGWDVESTYKKSKQSGYTRWFRGLHEAVVAEMEKRYSSGVLADIPLLKDEAVRLASPETHKHKEEIAEADHIAKEEILWVSRDGKEYNLFPYRKQRRVLDYVADALYEDGGFASRDEAMELFFKAQFDGRLLSVAHKVDKAFGEKSFRLLGEMDVDKNSYARVLDELMRRRRKIEAERELLKKEK